MLVGILYRDNRFLIQLPDYANKLPALIASSRLPKTKPNDCIHLMIITYTEETVEGIEIDSSNKKMILFVLYLKETAQQSSLPVSKEITSVYKY